MDYEELAAAVEQLNEELVLIRCRTDDPAKPPKEFLAEIEHCDHWKGVGYVYFIEVDRGTLDGYEGLCRLKAESVISLRKFENKPS